MEHGSDQQNMSKHSCYWALPSILAQVPIVMAGRALSERVKKQKQPILSWGN